MGGLFRKKVEETATWGKKKVDESKKAVLENQAGEAAIVEFKKRMDKVNIVTKPSASCKKKDHLRSMSLFYKKRKEGRNLHKCTFSMGLKGIVHHLFYRL